MRLLIESDYFSFLSGDQPSRILHHYAQQLLIDCDDVPAEIPLSAWQRIDDKPLMVNGAIIHLNDGEFEYQDHPHTLLKFIGPIDTLWLQQLKANGIKIRFLCPPHGICAAVPDRFRSTKIQKIFPFICSAMPYLGSHCSRGLDHDREKMQQAGLPGDACDLIFFSREVHVLQLI